MRPLDVRELADPVMAAQYLLGAIVSRTLDDGSVLSGRIVETEAYHESDPASHTYKGQTARNAAMFGPAGHAYVYFTYGVHWCFNVTAGKIEEGAGVLIRALEPLTGEEKMRQFRGDVVKRELTNGPAKLAQALAIDKSLYGHDLSRSPLTVMNGGTIQPQDIVTTTRIGISQGVEELMRFYIRGSDFVSRP